MNVIQYAKNAGRCIGLREYLMRQARSHALPEDRRFYVNLARTNNWTAVNWLRLARKELP